MKKLPNKFVICRPSAVEKSLRSRRKLIRSEFLQKVDPLEKRLLLADISITSSADLSQYYNSEDNSYNINAGSDSVTIASNLILTSTITGGASSNFTISGGQVTIGSNVSIITDGYNANGLSYPSGSIAISGKNISVGNHTIISANGATDSLDGNISLSAKNEKFTLGFNAWMQIEDFYNVFTNQSAEITLGNNTQIVGAAVSLDASSGNPLKYEGVTNVIAGLATLVGGLKGHPDPFSLPVTIQSWSPYSGLTIGTDSVVDSSSTITVSATTESVAKGHTSWFDKLNTAFGFGFGFFFSDAQANISVLPGAQLQAENDITITSSVDNTVELDVGSEKNAGVSPVNPNTVNIAYGLGSLTTDSVITVQAGSTIDSSQGSVNLTAEATDSNSVRVNSKIYRDGLAAISVGTLLTNANVQVIVDGSVSSGVPQKDQMDPVAIVFDQVQSVDLANNQLVFPSGSMSFQTGEELLFETGNGSTIPGLVPGQIYYAIVNPSEPNSLQLALSLADAQSGVNISFQGVYPTLTIGDTILPITFIDNTYSNAILFTFDTMPDGSPVLPNGNGTTVTYTPVAGQFIGCNDSSGNLIGPLAAGTYTVKLFQWPAGSPESQLYPLAIQLVDSQNQTVVLNPNSYFTTSNGTNLQVSLFNVETSTVDFNFSTPTQNPSDLTPLPVPDQQVGSLTNGESLVYTSGLNAPIGNLTNGQTYWAIVNPAQPGVIQIATSLAQSEAANPAVQNAIPMIQTADNQACLVSPVTDSFAKSSESSSLIVNSDNSYSLSNNATGGTFQLTINGPEGSATTQPLAYNITAEDLQTALNSIPNIQATVTGNPQSWNIAILIYFEIGNFVNGTELTFNGNPLLSDGTAVIYEGVAGKPVPGLVSGQTYYAFNQANPDFISQYPQYILTLKDTNDTSAPNVSFDLSQSMTDSSGQSYPISYSDPSSGLISLSLPEVTNPVVVNGDALVGGTVTADQLTTPALVVYTFANSGTFTISLTDKTTNITLTTSPIAYNATSSQLEQALNALSGVTATVTGSGTYTSPWTVTGIDTSLSVTGDSSNLQYEGKPTALSFDVFAENTQQVWLSGATGGTFTLTLSFGSNQLVTAPLPYNVSRQAFAQAINALGFQASVYGSGTPADPWQFMAYYNAFTTGQALTFQDAWDSNSLGMINGQTYYVVTSETQYDPSEVFLSLAASQANATASPPVLLNMQSFLQFEPAATGVMSGSAALVQLPTGPTGVHISATLTSKDYLTNKADIGLFPPIKALKSKYNGTDPYDVSEVAETKKTLEELNSVFDTDFGTLFFTDDEKKELDDKIQKNEDRLKKFDYKDPKSFLEASLGLSVMLVNNNSQVIIGSQAVISSGNEINLNSSLVEQFHAEADAGVTRTRTAESEKGNLASALALAVSIIDNTSQVIVQPNAELNSAGMIDISSDISYPFAWKASSISQLVNNWSNDSVLEKIGGIGGILVTIVSQALTGINAGVGNWLFNSSSNSSTGQKNTETGALLGSAIGGSIVIVDITNNNLAQICDGVRINQNKNYQSAGNQGLSVHANTQMEQISGSGQMDYFLNVAGIWTKKAIEPSQSKNMIGGSVNVLALDNTTQALIGGDVPQNGNSTAIAANGATQINYGNAGLSLDAQTVVSYIALSQSGGKATNIGIEASVAVASVENQNTTAAILSAANAPVIRNNPKTNGNISITASDNSLLVEASGGILAGKAINLGFSSSAVALNRNVTALIGSGNTTSGPANVTWPVIQSAGNVTINANASGQLVPVSASGSFISKKPDEQGKEIPGYPGNHFGFGVSGDYSEAVVNDQIYAGVNGGNLTGVSNEQSINIQAINSTRLNLGTGAASFQFEKGRDSAAGFGGAASYVDYTSSVVSGIANSAVESFTIEIGSENTKTIGTFAAGLDGASVAGVGIAVAGSVAINQVTNKTIAEIDEINGSDLGGVSLKALEADHIWAAAGTVTFVTSFGSDAELDEGKLKTKIGLGLGFAQNQLDSKTHAIISNSNLSQSSASVSLSAEQVSRSFVLAAGTVFEAGQGTGITAYGMIALNQYTNADVQAIVQNSEITSSSTDASAGMTIAAELVPIMITAAGDLGLSIAWKSGSGSEVSIGAGVSVTTVSITGNSVASVSNSNIVLNQGNLAVSAYTGQASNYTSLNNTLTSLNLPLGNYNLYSLAIAGGLSTAFDPVGDLAVGVNGVGAGIGSTTLINTIANIFTGSQIQLLGKNHSGGLLSVSALENLSVYDNAGGASIDISVSKETSVGVVVGIGAGVHTSSGSVIANITDSNVETAGEMNVTANTTSTVNVIGFGVALDQALSESGGMGVAVSASSATASITSSLSILSNITGGNISSGGALNLTAADNSSFYTGVGSGSLSVSFGTDGGVSLSAGASVSVISPSHTVSATIGSADDKSAPQTIVNASGPVSIQAINNQVLTAQAIVVASSVAIGGDASVAVVGSGASSCITMNNNITAGVLFGTTLKSDQGHGSQAISITAEDHANVSSTVGTGAIDVSISEIPVGASLGISLSEITNNDSVNAIVQGACLTTEGGNVLIESIGNNSHFSESVATSVSISLGVAGAGGNSNIFDNANIAASVDSGASVITGNSATGYGSLSVLSNSSESLLAQIFGGTGGIGSIGVFLSDASRSGATTATFTTTGEILVGDLSLAATSNQTVTSEGMSVTIGGLAGTGEVHQVTVNELVETTVNASGNTWTVNGNLSIGASSTNAATAQTSGAGNEKTSISIGELGVGYFEVTSSVSPTVNVSVSEINLTVSGSSSFGALSNLDNTATARAGAGSLVGGDAAQAETDNSPKISLSTSNLNLSSGSTTFLTGSCITYGTFADSIYATIAGGSAALADNSSAPNLSLSLGSGTLINTSGSVIVSSVNNIMGLGEGQISKAKGMMARVGSGGIVGGYGASSISCLTGSAMISLADNVSMTARHGGAIRIGSSQNWFTNQLSYVSTGSAVGGANIQSSLASCLTSGIDIGSGVSLSAPEGMLGIGTNINSQTTSDTYSYTFGLVGGSSSNSQNSQCATQSVTIGENSSLTAGGDITVTPGVNPVNQSGSALDNDSIVTAHCSGLISIPGATAGASTSSDLSLVVDPGTQIISDMDVELGPVPGINNALWYTFTNYDGSKGTTKNSTNGATQTSTTTINGNVVAGNTHELEIIIPESGNSLTVNGQTVNLTDTSGSLIDVEPQAGVNFIPFQLGCQTNYNATQMLEGLDATSQNMLKDYISTGPVPAITLANLAATGGQVVINADQLSGNATISAYSPNITIDNSSPAYLLINGMGIPNTLNMGKITVIGSATVPKDMTTSQHLALPSVTINQNYSDAVGTGTKAGPAIGIFGPIVNAGGSVAVSNANGSLVQQAAITAQSVTISTPNAAFIVNTPNSYYGPGGDITNYWIDSSSYVKPGLNSYVTEYTANLAATTAADVIYLSKSGATNSIEFSNWLYNNQNIAITEFVNVNITSSNIGSNYPGNGKNWGSTEQGTGIIFFGSEIPYIWQTGSISFSSGSQYLSQSCATGYLDTYSNAQTLSVAASGNPADSTLNVTQGTGPQYASNVGRGIYPVVPSDFPTSLTVSNPQNVTLSSGVTAAQIDITALYIDINAPINVGVLNSGFQATLPASLGQYIACQTASNPAPACITLPSNYLGGANSGLTGYFDTQANQIVISPIAINAGVVGAVFSGNLISTTNKGQISVNSNAGQNLIDNQSGYPLVIQGIGATGETVAGVVQFNDTVANQSTAYVYRGDNIVEQYQGKIGANMSQMSPVANLSGTNATYTPSANLAWQWSQKATISRNLSFKNTNNSYDLYGPSFNDSWSWGGLDNGTAPANYTSSVNPFMQGMTSSLVSLDNPISDYTEIISACITEQETAETLFINNAGYAWNFGPCTTWTWTYPTEITLSINNQLPACNPIAIDFSGVSCGSLTVNSNSSLMLDGIIQFPGSVSFSSSANITQSTGAEIAAGQVSLTASGMAGNSSLPLNLNVASGDAVEAQTGSGLYLSSAGNLVTGSLMASNGPVVIQTGGSLLQSGSDSTITGTDITLIANGTIGTQDAAIAIQTQPTQLETGSLTGGLLTASAPESIYLTQNSGDLRIASVLTTSPVGVVSISVINGNIIDGNIADIYDFNSGNLTSQQISRVIDSIRMDNTNSANLTVAAYEGSVDQNYLQYWTMVANQSTIGNLTLNNGVYGLPFPLATVQNGTVNLTANGISYYQQQANLYYANSANQTANATAAQVNAYANIVYDNAVSVFQNNMAFGSDWLTLPQFQSYQSNYTYTASNATVSALTYGAFDVTNSFGQLSLDALSPANQNTFGNITRPAIQTAVLNLSSSGSVGLMLDPVEIDMNSIQTGNLTAYEKSLLSKATHAGELQFVGTNSHGEKVIFSAGSEPANVTITGVVVKIEQPLFVNLTDNGLSIINAGTTINLTETDGDLNILGMQSAGHVSIASQQDINQIILQDSMNKPGWSQNGSGILGYNADGSWTATSLQSQNIDIPDGIVCADHVITGNWVGSANNTSTAQPGLDSLQLTYGENGENNEANAYWYPQKIDIPTTGSFYVNFVYQASGTGENSGGGITLAFQNEGLNALGSNGNGLGYLGISGNTAAFQIYTQQNEIPYFYGDYYDISYFGTNFVTTNTTGNNNTTLNQTLSSGTAILVQLVYDADNQTVSQTLTDWATGQSSITTYSGVDLSSVLGDQAYIGFTGSDGFASSALIQTISNFSLLNSYGETLLQDFHVKGPSNLRMVAGGAVGSSTNSLNIRLSGELNAYVNEDLYLNSQSSGCLTIGSVFSGGQVQINATGSILSTDDQLMGSIAGFGTNGTGWTFSSGNGTASVSDNVLQLENSAINPSDEVSFASAYDNTLYTVENSFITSFLYETTTPGSDFYFVLRNGQSTNDPNSDILKDPEVVGLLLTSGVGSTEFQTVGLMYNGTMHNLQIPGDVILDSGNPIHVVLTYNHLNNTATVSLTDTVTNQSYSFVNPDINMLKYLGAAKAQIGFYSQGTGSVTQQSVQGFSFSYGSPTIQAESATLSSNSGMIGTSVNPILTLVTGNITSTAPDGVYLIQTDGDMYVQSIDSSGTVSLSAPAGAVVGTGSGTVQATRRLRAASVKAHSGVRAKNLQIQSLTSIGNSEKALEIQATNLGASTILGDIRFSQSGPTTIQGGITAGGLISILADSGFHVSSGIKAAGSVSIETLPDIYGQSRVVVSSGGSVTSTGDQVSIIGGNGVSLGADSLIASLGSGDKSHVFLGSVAEKILASYQYDVNVSGSVKADQIQMDSPGGDRNHYLNLSAISGQTQKPLIHVSGTDSNNTLTVDDSTNNISRVISIQNGNITTPDHDLTLNVIDSVLISFGSGSDEIEIGKLTGLRHLAINTGGGDDLIRTMLPANETITQNFDGGSGFDSVLINSDNQPVWMKQQQVTTLTSQVQFHNMNQIAVAGTSAANALPVADRFVLSDIRTDQPLSNSQYVNLVYQKVLNRNATTTEIAMGTRLLDRNVLNRDQYARRILSSTESLRVQVNAWYQTYLNRQATAQEVARQVTALRRGQSAQTLVSRLLAGPEFYQRTQLTIHSGSASDRYLIGLYRFAIDPSSNPDAGQMQFLRQTLRRQGRQAVAVQMINSEANAANQTEVISIKINQIPASPGMSVRRIGPNGLTARLLSRK